MNTKNLKVGQIVKNHRQLCELLEIPYTKGGNARESQLKQIERFIRYEKENKKYQYTILEIYEVPLPPNNNITKYIPLIEKLILHYIIVESDQNNKLHIPKGRLWRILQMINNEYSIMKYKQMRLSHTYNIPKETILDFYTTSDDLLERNIENALKSLKNQSLIHWNNVFSVVEIPIEEYYLPEEILFDTYENIDEYGDLSYHVSTSLKYLKEIHREATEEETKTILRVQRETLQQLECESISSAIKSGKGKEFYSIVNEVLFNELSIKMYYQSYELIYNMDHIIKQYERADVFLLDDESRELYSKLLNDEIVSKIIDNGTARHQKALQGEGSKNLMDIRKSENYVNDTIKLTNGLIKVKNKKKKK